MTKSRDTDARLTATDGGARGTTGLDANSGDTAVREWGVAGVVVVALESR